MRGEYFFDKKGISPVIGTMLLILIVIVMASMFSIWAFKFVSDTQERALIDKMCNDVDFVSGNFCYNNLSIENLETGEITSSLQKYLQRSWIIDPGLPVWHPCQWSSCTSRCR